MPKFALLLFGLVLSVNSLAATKTNATFADMQATLGMVPSFFKQFPADALPGAWEEFKNIQVGGTSLISPKNKELMGLAIAAQIPCTYCTYFHTRFARLNGATDAEINEAIALSSMTRKWSAYFYGTQVDYDAFKKEVGKAVSHLKETTAKNAMTSPAELTDAPSAMKDIESTFGFVPEFFKTYPRLGLVGAWREMRDFTFNPKTALDAKAKDLISLAVGSQIPCQYCVYSDSEFAKFEGASAEELRETALLAGLVRHWSTYLHGLQMDERKFRQEVDKLANSVKRRMASAPSLDH